MHITLESDYAVRIVYCLATAGRRMDAKAISEQTGVTLRFSLKILRKLVSAGIVKSYKGSQGGYEINRDPSEITLRDVIEIVEGPLVISRCIGNENFSCNRVESGSPCKFQKIYDDISVTLQQKLSSVRFSDLID